MASVNLTGSYSGSSASSYTIRCVCSSTSNGSTANTSNVTVTLQMRRVTGTADGGNWQWNLTGKATGRIVINGSDSGNRSVTFDTRKNIDWITLTSYTVNNIPHDADGSKSINIKGYFEPNATTTLSGGKVDGTFVLDKIPRYATSTQSLSSKTETTITMNWSSDNTVDYIWYSTDDGAKWNGKDVTDGKSGTYTISGLAADTTYQIKTRVRRKDSQLTTDSSALSVATYNFPYCTDMPNFTIGDSVTLKFYNPLNRKFTWQSIGADGSVISEREEAITSYKGFTATSTIENLYMSIPNAQSGTYKIKVVYGTSTITKTGGTYKIKGTEVPTINAITYADTNTRTTNITKNPQNIVQNLSNLKVTFEEATSTYFTDGTFKHTFELNGVTKTSTANGGTINFGTVDSASDLKLTVTVTDSRGLTAKTTKTIKMLAWSSPVVSANLERLNNYEDTTYFTINASVSSVDSKNTMDIIYRYRESNGDFGDGWDVAENRKKYTFTFDKNKSYVFEVSVTDAFTSTEKTFTLSKGRFPLFIDTKNNAVGINEFPAEDEALKVSGGYATFTDGIVLCGGTKNFVITITDSGELSINELK